MTDRGPKYDVDYDREVTEPRDGPGEKSGIGGVSWKAIVIVVVVAYVLLLIVVNSERVKVDFVVVQARTRLIFLILVAFGLGALVMWLLPRFVERRGRKQ